MGTSDDEQINTNDESNTNMNEEKYNAQELYEVTGNKSNHDSKHRESNKVLVPFISKDVSEVENIVNQHVEKNYSNVNDK